MKLISLHIVCFTHCDVLLVFFCQDERSALHIASYWGHVEVVKLLLAAGAPVDQQDKVMW